MNIAILIWISRWIYIYIHGIPGWIYKYTHIYINDDEYINIYVYIPGCSNTFLLIFSVSVEDTGFVVSTYNMFKQKGILTHNFTITYYYTSIVEIKQTNNCQKNMKSYCTFLS